MKISACLILKDSAKSIKECLSSIKPYADEIICVIDSRSTDLTEQICRNYTDKVFVYEWKTDSFADARNYSISKATGNWVLFLDSDETLLSFKMPSDEFDIYNIQFRLPDGIVYWHYRLFKKDIGKFVKPTHERLEANRVLKYGGIIGEAYHNIDLQDRKEKTKWLLDRMLKELTEEPDPTSHHHISNCYRQLEDHYKCIDYAQLALRDKIQPENKAAMCINIFKSYKMLGEDYLAHQYLCMSLGYCFDQICGHALLMDYYYEIEMPEMVQKQEEIIKEIASKGSKLPLDITISHVRFYDTTN